MWITLKPPSLMRQDSKRKQKIQIVYKKLTQSFNLTLSLLQLAFPPLKKTSQGLKQSFEGR